MKNETSVPNAITPEEFQEFLNELQLVEVRIRACECTWLVEPFDIPDSQTFEFGHGSQIISASEREAVVSSFFGATVHSGGKTEIARLVVDYWVRYMCPREMDEAIFEQFRRLSLRLHTVPFAREWIH